jgi:hypothetical protein
VAAEVTLRSIKLVNYKGFAHHTIRLKGSNVLIGANNAGKSTALGAIRLLAAMVPVARRTAPTTVARVDGMQVLVWPITAKAIEISALSFENIRHDFRPTETRIEAVASTGARMVVSWPADEDADGDSIAGVFSVYPPDGMSPKPRVIAQTLLPTIAIVPTLTPLEQHESLVGAETVTRHLNGRRSSRYFRNALALLSDSELAEFTAFIYERTPEIHNLSLVRSFGNKDDVFDLFFEEESNRHEREIGWAGDGIHIWIQCLFHLWRQRDASVVILDEPDVFLHPDLQRRLARALFGQGRQTIVATHSVEILAECEPGSAVWIDRSRRSAERPRPDGALALLGRRLGSGYELGVGRALRSRTVLFVEGDDAPLLARFAAVLGMRSVASSENYATVPLGGFGRNWRAGAFTETMAALGGSVETFVVLDGDLRSQEEIEAELAELRKSRARICVWARREIENYLLVPEAIAKASSVPVADAAEMLAAAIEMHRDEASLALQTQRLEERRRKGSATARLSERTVLQLAMEEFGDLWASTDGRRSVVDAKLVLRTLNGALQAAKKRTVNPHSITKGMTKAGVHEDIVKMLQAFEALLAPRP